MSADLYSRSGVDQSAADGLAGWIARAAGSRGGIGGFAGLHEIPGARGKLLVACTDGVGTKLMLAVKMGRHDSIGIDCVAMCVNDLITTGARPLFFLDYIGIGKLRPDVAKSAIKGVITGCREAGCVLLGGETAQLPGIYSGREYDLVGFAVGIVDRRDLIDGSRTKPGDVLLGLASNGVHSNGYTLVRSIVKKKGLSLSRRVKGLEGALGDELLRPTRIYVKALGKLLGSRKLRGAVKAIAHITGGGIPGNLPRVLPEGAGAALDRSAWPRPSVFDLVREWGRVPEEEMYGVFNMGLGMILAVDRKREAECRKALGSRGVYRIGEVVKGPREVSWA